MKPAYLSSRALTIRETLLGLTLLMVLLAMIIPLWLRSTVIRHGDGSTQALSNLRQLQLATYQMTLDLKGDPNSPAWTSLNGKPLAYAQWRSLLIEGKYLNPQDFTKLTTLTDRGGWFGGNRAVSNAITVYAVCKDDPDTTLLFTTKNWHGLDAKSLSGAPFETRGFAVFRKGGDGAILLNKLCQRADLIGSGGKFNYQPLQ
ncbi:type II secretory pathway, pseudopilin PulG [Terrimicrobium sacchariphilum]|uniref:Type II secretory pathway, pseudopilin PulG n=1 Tax=Terrimicrobium sacchariphilum TaxID=690879 RepID=A0A146G1I3_TERSA|nr:hypothetical protein [Terrimicrobium sacchariphilum]GAT31695.1 type II secretory pathway, pseudopilin PulG [Terrimicrobium sacchariphilum]